MLTRGSKIFLIVLIGVIVSYLVACGETNPPSVSNSKISGDSQKTMDKQDGNSLKTTLNTRPKVYFCNPGLSKADFWSTVADFMNAAAKDLDIDLEIAFAERDHLKMISQGLEVASRTTNKPDYMIVVNEKSSAPKIMEAANNAGIKVFLMSNDLSEEQKKTYGNPREKLLNWIGTMIPDNILAGEMITEPLLSVATQKSKPGEKIKMVTISGSRATQASINREQGQANILKKFPNVENLQTVYGEFLRDKGYELANGLVKRYPDAKVYWCANDLMALGALKALREAGKTPGKDVFIGGLNWDKEALDEIKTGGMTNSAGGHFMIGAWALTSILDYHNKIDFKDSEGKLLLEPGCFNSIEPANIDNYLKIFGDQNWSKINFKAFSKKYNATLNKYDFSLKKIIENVKK